MLLALACRHGGSAPVPGGDTALPTLSELLARAFPGVALMSAPGQGLSLANDPRWRLTFLPPQLEGKPWGLLAFFALEGPEGVAPGLGLPPGVYAIAADASLYALSADASRLLPVAAGSSPPAHPAPPGTARPLLALDADADGRDDIALAVQGEALPAHYRLYWRREDGWAQEEPGPSPVQTVLDYWGAVASALDLAGGWSVYQRQRFVWPWLSVEEEGPSADRLVSALAEETGRAPEQELEALEGVRTAFRAAWSALSPQFQERQTWPGFINAFRLTEAAQLEAVSTPQAVEGSRTHLKAVVSLRQREGEDVVWRRFQVTFRLVLSPDGRWLLDDVGAEEVR